MGRKAKKAKPIKFPYRIPILIVSTIEIDEKAGADALQIISEDPAHKELLKRLEIAVKQVQIDYPERGFEAMGHEVVTASGEFTF